MEPSPERALAIEDLAQQQATLLDLFARDNRDFDATVRDLLTQNARTLEVARCSLWSLRPDQQSIRCEAMFDANHPDAAADLEIPSSAAPRYFAALTSGRVIAADDARADPRTSEFTDGYLVLHGITSMLDVPIYVGGALVGVLCHEHVGPRRSFSLSEQRFAFSIGQLLSLAIESQRRGVAERALQSSEARLRAIIESALDAIITTDGAGIIEGWNPQAAQLFGWSEAEALGRPMETTIVSQTEESPILAALKAGVPADRSRVEFTGHTRDGRTFVAEAALAPVEIGERRVLSAFVRDISERKRLEEELRRQAFHDALTALPNRSFFARLISRELSLVARNPQHRFALLFIDLDGFKLVNDSLGHDAGDQLLVEIARRLGACLRGSDTAARLGGDEFTILLTPINRDEDAVGVAERIAHQLSVPVAIGTHEVVPSASIGILLSDPVYTSADQMLRDADAAMYRAKEGGKARYELFNRDIHKQNLERLEIETDLRYAVQREQLRLHYQPIVEIASGRIVGVEALLRWQRAPGRLLFPGDFLRVSEETRDINAIGRWVFDRAIAQVAAWNRRFAKTLSLSVNIARPQFFQPDLPDAVHEMLARHQLEAELLRFELSEKLLLKDPGVISTALRKLPGTKCIDDFGTGLSSLSQLPELNIQSIKIDRAFVNRIDDYKELVRAIAALAHNLSMEVMVEGVETEAMLERLRDLGCDLAQGYWFARPAPPEEMEALLTR
jgi:diguanylate cyclase (GGDEF)-like protein/PAS domain S-box-containing protein